MTTSGIPSPTARPTSTDAAESKTGRDKVPALGASDRVTLYLALVPYLLQNSPVSVAEAAARFQVTPADMRDLVRQQLQLLDRVVLACLKVDVLTRGEGHRVQAPGDPVCFVVTVNPHGGQVMVQPGFELPLNSHRKWRAASSAGLNTIHDRLLRLMVEFRELALKAVQVKSRRVLRFFLPLAL